MRPWAAHCRTRLPADAKAKAMSACMHAWVGGLGGGHSLLGAHARTLEAHDNHMTNEMTRANPCLLQSSRQALHMMAMAMVQRRACHSPRRPRR